MKKRNENIDKYRHERLPDPEIPADEAWAYMDGILGSAVTPVKAPGDIEKLLKYKWVFVFLSAVTIVSAIILIKTAYQPLNEKGLKLKSANTTRSPIVKLEKNAEKIADVAKPTETATSNEMPLDTSGFNPYIENRNKTVIPTPSKVADETRKVTLKQLDKSSQSTESAILEVYPTAKIAKRNTQNSSNAISWQDSMKREGVLKSNNLQNNKQLIIKDEKNSVSVISKNKRSEEFLASPADGKSINSTSSRTNVSTVPFLIPISEINKSHQPIYSRTIIEIPQYQADAPNHKQIRSIQFGPEWGLNSSLTNTDYLFAGKDSVSKPALLLIPGIFVSKSWQQHSVSFTFSPYQSYFGNGRIVVHAIEPTLSNDSVKSYNNMRLIKASGLNFSMYYHYKATKIFALSAGFSYSFFSNALVRKEFENYAGIILPGALTNLNKSAGLMENINPRLFALKGGLLLTPGRFQVGINFILPITNVSRDDQMSLKPLNGQLFIRMNCF